MSTRLRATIALVGLAFVAAGCAADDPLPEAEAAPAEPVEIPDDALDFTGQAAVTVTVQDNVFEQREIVVSAGAEITWHNEGRQTHNVTPSEDDAFVAVPTTDLEPDETASRTFDEAGDFPYYCSLHGTARIGQTGRVIVVAG